MDRYGGRRRGVSHRRGGGQVRYVWVRYACFYPVLGPFSTVFSPFFRAARLPGAKTERTRQRRRKMGEKWPKSWCRNPPNHTYTPPLMSRWAATDGIASQPRSSWRTLDTFWSRQIEKFLFDFFLTPRRNLTTTCHPQRETTRQQTLGDTTMWHEHGVNPRRNHHRNQCFLG